MPDNNYATKQDLADLRAHVDERFATTKQELADMRAHVDERFDQVVEATRDMQTEVLRAFHGWARPPKSNFAG